MECNSQNCELKKEIAEIRRSSDEFQEKVATSVERFQVEIRQSINSLDARHKKARDALETELRSEISSGLMSANNKLDAFVENTNSHLISISGDLGEIKGALGLKTEKTETNTLQTDVYNKIESVKIEAIKANSKVLYVIISLLSSGLFFVLGYYILK